VDIRRGRLLLFAMFNPGRVAEALEAIRLRTQDGKDKANLRVFAEVEVGGARYLAELPLGDNSIDMVMEARSLASAVEVAATLAQGIQEQLPDNARRWFDRLVRRTRNPRDHVAVFDRLTCPASFGG
jgi:hypothetical protein